MESLIGIILPSYDQVLFSEERLIERSIIISLIKIIKENKDCLRCLEPVSLSQEILYDNQENLEALDFSHGLINANMDSV